MDSLFTKKAKKKTDVSKRCPSKIVMSPVNHWSNIGTQLFLENVVQQLWSLDGHVSAT